MSIPAVPANRRHSGESRNLSEDVRKFADLGPDRRQDDEAPPGGKNSARGFPSLTPCKHSHRIQFRLAVQEESVMLRRMAEADCKESGAWLPAIWRGGPNSSRPLTAVMTAIVLCFSVESVAQPDKTHTRADNPTPHGLHRLSDRALRTAVVGKTLTYRPEPGFLVITSGYQETFGLDGSYSMISGHSGKTGTYKVKNGRICVYYPEESDKECWYIFRSGTGSLYRGISPRHTGQLSPIDLK